MQSIQAHRPARYSVIRILLAFVLSLGLGTSVLAQPFYRNEGLPRAVKRLERAESGIRILHVGAHPDDEDSALVAALSLGRGARVTYLSLTRGEGGQNLIGPELFEDLGVIRTLELLAAREEDGAAQLFGRQIDFGFSKTAEEALRIWGEENCIEDVVRAIRLTRPHIVISRFSGTPRDGHGQHQAAAIACRKAVEAAADPTRFPNLIEEGLKPWKVEKFYSGRLGDSGDDTLTVPTAVYDPWFGRSLGAIGYRGRSLHRSQDMGMIEYEESRPAKLRRELPLPEAPENDLFDGLSAKPISMPLEAPRELAKRAAAKLAEARANGADGNTIDDLQIAYASLLGLRLEAFASDPAVAVGGTAEVECRARAPKDLQLDGERWTIDAVPGLDARPISKEREEKSIERMERARSREPGRAFFAETNGVEKKCARFSLEAARDAAASLPYYLHAPRAGYLYQWPADPGAAGRPFERPAAVAVFEATLEGTPIKLSTPVERRRADPAYGEIREDLAIVPEVSVEFDPPRLAMREDQPGPAKFSMLVRNLSDAEGAGKGTVEIFAEANPAQPLASYAAAPGNDESVRITVEIPRGKLAAKHGALGARWVSAAGGAAPALTVKHVDYRHIRPRYLCRPARLVVDQFDLALPENISVGYVRGSGDEVPRVLAQLGAAVTFLESEDLARGDLSRFDAIVLGVRAYEVRDDLAANNARILDYARAGGAVIAQYNKHEFQWRGAAPFEMKMKQPAARVTDETAPVEILDAAHRVFTFPNKIEAKDFDGWIQERGLYFWETWSEQYAPLLRMNDPGEPPQRGALLYARLGEGHYVYTGLAFFRQLPEGVEGAARLFANLISLRRAPQP